MAAKPNYLQNVKSVSDNGNTFVIHHGDHGVFEIAKKGLRPETVKQIQAFAEGGEVGDPPMSDDDVAATYGPGMDPSTQMLWESRGLPQPVSPGQGTVLQNPAGAGSVLQPPAPDLGNVNAPQDLAALPLKTGEAEESGPAAPAEASAPASATPAQPAQVATAQPAAVPGAGSSDLRAIDKATQQEADAEEKRQNIERNRQMAAAQLQEASLQRQAQIQKDFEAKYQAVSAKQDALANDIANGKIDGNRWWDSRDTGQKVSATIGMILGGIGAGMTGGPNQALEIIQNAISRDMEAQKANLGKKQSLLSMYVQQGHDVQDAMKLAAAHELAAVEGQLKASASRYAALETAPIAQSIAAQLQTRRVQMRQEVISKGYDNAIKQADAQIKHIQLAMAGNLPAQAAVQNQLKTMAATGKPIPPEYAPLLDEKMVVQTPEGIRLAKDPDARKEIDQIQQAAGELKSAISDARRFRQSNKGGTYAGGAVAQQARDIHARLLMALAQVHDIKGLRPNVVEQFEKQLRDAGGTFLSGTTDDKVFQSLDDLDAGVNAKLRSVYASNLQGGTGVARGSFGGKAAGR
jgi:hypothetical protein